jgi:hypothetical protein
MPFGTLEVQDKVLHYIEVVDYVNLRVLGKNGI